jgi:RNA-dependent RNA polymerase
MFNIIKNSDLTPTEHVDPALYPPGEVRTIQRPSTVYDICDFIVEYIHSDVLASQQLASCSEISLFLQGLLSDRHLVIAGRILSLAMWNYAYLCL